MCITNIIISFSSVKHLKQRIQFTLQDVDVDVNIKKGDWKAKHDSMLDAIKEAKKTRPPSAKKDIEVQIVVK